MTVLDFNLYEQRREEILDVARECFAEKGFNATTMVEVARRTGMSVGNLYNYFHGKAAIVECLAEREVKKLADQVARLKYSKPTRQERLQHLRDIALASMDMKRARVTLEIFAEAVHNDQLRQIIVRSDDKIRELLAQMYRSYGDADDKWLEVRITVDMAVMDREKLANEIAIQVLNQWETDRKFDQTRS